MVYLGVIVLNAIIFIEIFCIKKSINRVFALKLMKGTKYGIRSFEITVDCSEGGEIEYLIEEGCSIESKIDTRRGALEENAFVLELRRKQLKYLDLEFGHRRNFDGGETYYAVRRVVVAIGMGALSDLMNYGRIDNCCLGHDVSVVDENFVPRVPRDIDFDLMLAR